MKKNERKQLLNDWPYMSIEDREQKLLELEEILPTNKYKKMLHAIEKIEYNIQEESQNYNEENNFEESNHNEENNFEESNHNEENNFEESNHNEENNFEESNHNEENNFEESNHNEENNFEESNHNEENNFEESNHNEENNFEESDENWIIEKDELEIEDKYNEFGPKYGKEEYFKNINIPKSNAKQNIGSKERAWNNDDNIIYSQEELIYKLSNSNNISDEEYKRLLISAQKKIEFIQLLIEKSRVKNAAYSFDFLNSMCWRVDKALKTFLEKNKR